MGGQPKEGIARCTFEDKIKMSDIVFLRAWTQVEVPRFYNPLTTSLQPHEKTWQGMKTTAELRREHNLPIPVNKDSLYKVIYEDVKLHIAAARGFSLNSALVILHLLSLVLFFPVLFFSFVFFFFSLCQQPIERKLKKFNPLVIPKSLQSALPFSSKPKDIPSRKRPLLENRRAVVMEPHERKVHTLVQHLGLIRNEKVCTLP